MSKSRKNISKHFAGNFLTPIEKISEKLSGIKAFLFDWDGVFNNGEKNEKGSSPFSELDSMGTNLLRFNHYLRKGLLPFTAIVTGERNESAFTLARREHFHAVYYTVKNKISALNHFCSLYGLKPKQICFFYDDVTDLSIAPDAGLRIKIGNHAVPLLNDYITRNKFADYITSNSGGQHAIREAVELLMGLSNHYDDTVSHRVQFSPEYQTYLKLRNAIQPEFIT